MTYYLDASFLVALFKDEESTERARLWLSDNDAALLTSQLGLGEARSAFSRQVRSNNWNVREASDASRRLDRWIARAVDIVSVQNEDVRDAAAMVLQPIPKLLMPDAIHLALCRRMVLILVTFDQDLSEVAAREGVKAVIPA